MRNRTTLWAMMGLYIGCGLVFIGIATPLVQRWIEPNQWYGFRVERTLNDRAVWYDANEYSGRQMIGASVVLIVVAALAAVVMAWRGTVNIGLYIGICTVVLVGGMLVMLLRSLRYLDRL